jgi:hypothetical protein
MIWFSPEDPSSNGISPAAQQWLRAKAAYDAEDWARASRLLSIALKLDPSNSQCKTALATAEAKLREQMRSQLKTNSET